MEAVAEQLVPPRALISTTSWLDKLSHEDKQPKLVRETLPARLIWRHTKPTITQKIMLYFSLRPKAKNWATNMKRPKRIIKRSHRR